MPPVLTVEFITRPMLPSLIPVYSNSCSNRIQKLHKSDRRVFCELVVFVMEKSFACGATISENFYKPDHLKALFMNQSKRTYEHASLDDLGYSLSESLHIRDPSKVSLDTVQCQPFDENDNVSVHYDANGKDVDIDTIGVSAMDLTKRATFPCSGKTPMPTISTDEEDGGVNDSATAITAYSRSISLPSPLKLVSAMKGTREKLGTSRDKPSVTWAPDVYDPPPSAPSTAVVMNKPRRKSDRKKIVDSKKNGKSKQKKKSSKGSSSSSSSSKDKRSVQKYSRSNAYYQSFEDEGDLVVEGLDCASSFLKSSVTNLHFSVAEST